MSDISIVWDPTTGSGDFAMFGTGLLTGHDLETAILISYFTDAQADPGDPGFDGGDPRGWWADTYAATLEDPTLTPIPGDQTGSKIWEIFSMPRTQPTLNWLRDEMVKRLDWMITDGVAIAIDVVTFFTGPGGVGGITTITSPNGNKQRYPLAWSEAGYAPVPPTFLADPAGGFVADPVSGGFVGSP